jgi:hypothetical protein
MAGATDIEAIDNSDILLPTTQYCWLSRSKAVSNIVLIPDLEEDKDFLIIPELLWNLLVSTFGVNPNQTVCRNAALTTKGEVVVLVHMTRLMFTWIEGTGRSYAVEPPMVFYAEPSEEIAAIKGRICSVFNSQPGVKEYERKVPENCRLYKV